MVGSLDFGGGGGGVGSKLIGSLIIARKPL